MINNWIAQLNQLFQSKATIFTDESEKNVFILLDSLLVPQLHPFIIKIYNYLTSEKDYKDYSVKFLITNDSKSLSLDPYQCRINYFAKKLPIKREFTLSKNSVFDVIKKNISQTRQNKSSLFPFINFFSTEQNDNSIASDLRVCRKNSLYYWKDLLKYFSQSTFPVDHLQTEDTCPNMQQVKITLDLDVSQKLKTFTEANKATVTELFLASFNAFLFRYSNEEDVCMGIKIQSLINDPLPLRLQITDQVNFKELLTQTKNALSVISRYSKISTSELVNLSHYKSDFPKRNPLFNLIFIDEKSISNPVTPHPFDYDLIFSIQKNEDFSYSYCFEYNKKTFDRGTILRMSKNYKKFLQNIINTPHQKISTIDFISDTEKQQLLSWYFGESTKAQEKCIHKIFEDNALENPNKIAVVYENTQLSYKTLNEKANQLAHYLLNTCVKPGDTIAISMKRSMELTVAILAALKAGCPIATVETSEKEIEFIKLKINTTRPKIILTESNLVSLFNECKIPCITINKTTFTDKDRQNISNPNLNITINNAVYLPFTSGTTSDPKGIITKHIGWSNWITFMRKVLKGDIRVYLSLPITFDASFWEIFCLALGQKGTLYINRDEEQYNQEALRELFLREKITIATLTPSLLREMLPKDFPTLKYIFAIGEVLTKEIVQPWLEQGTLIFNGYGPTEVTAGVTLFECKINDSISIGKPIDNTNVYILNSQQQMIPMGFYGEIYIGGKGVAGGYLNQPDATQKAFLPDPFSKIPQARMYKTGDIGRFRPDGTIEFLGRKDGQIKLYGVRIETEEIINKLCEHPAIKNAAVKAWGENNNKYLAAYVVFHPNQHANSEQLVEFLSSKKLQSIKIPSEFVEMNQLPKTANGKINTKALPKPPQKSAAKPIQEESLTETQQKVLQIWEKVLFKYITKKDDYTRLGGNSMGLIRIINMINKEFFNNSKTKLTIVDIPTTNLNILNLSQIIDLKVQQSIKHNQKRSSEPEKTVFDDIFNFTVNNCSK